MTKIPPHYVIVCNRNQSILGWEQFGYGIAKKQSDMLGEQGFDSEVYNMTAPDYMPDWLKEVIKDEIKESRLYHLEQEIKRIHQKMKNIEKQYLEKIDEYCKEFPDDSFHDVTHFLKSLNGE